MQKINFIDPMQEFTTADVEEQIPHQIQVSTVH